MLNVGVVGFGFAGKIEIAGIPRDPAPLAPQVRGAAQREDE